VNVLVIAPHPDDEAIGCGGAVCRHAAAGDRVTTVYLTSGELGLKRLPREKAWEIREAEARRAAKILGISSVEFLRLPDWMAGEQVAEGARRLLPVLQRERPALIYLPHPSEWHPDHRAALPILRAAARRIRTATATLELRGYEVWTPVSEFHHVVDITEVLPRKLRALRAHRSQAAEFDYVRAVRGLNQFRGELAGKCRYAEVFAGLSLKPTRAN
jgi:LmbE family N-acetylglucosaminyl deacetylase